MTCRVVVGWLPLEDGTQLERRCGREAVATWASPTSLDVDMCRTHDRRAQRLVRERARGTEGWARIQTVAA